MGKSVSLSAADAFVREAKRMDSVPPTVIGYGITSDPIRDVTSDHLFAATPSTIGYGITSDPIRDVTSGKAWQPDCDRQHPRNGGCPGDLVPPRQEWSGVRGGAGVCFAHGASQI